MMMDLLYLDTLYDIPYSSDDDSYHIVTSDDDDTDIIDGDAVNSKEDPLWHMDHHNRLWLSKLYIRNLKWVASIFQNPTDNAKKLGNMWGIIINKSKNLIRKTAETAIRDFTNNLNRLFKRRQSLLHCQYFWGRASIKIILSSMKSVCGNKTCRTSVTDFGNIKFYTHALIPKQSDKCLTNKVIL